MLYLKEANLIDAKKEFAFIQNIPNNENGFTNENYNCSWEEFIQKVLPEYIDIAHGINLPNGWVSSTEYFLWEDNTIKGLFRLRHHLNDFLREGPGHIGYYIKEEYRHLGYATQGLQLCINKAWEIIPENEIYMSVQKDNTYSLKVQLNNGAYIHHEDITNYYTRISKKIGNL